MLRLSSGSSSWVSGMSRTPRRDWALLPVGQEAEDRTSSMEELIGRRRSVSSSTTGKMTREALPAGFGTPPLRVTVMGSRLQREPLVVPEYFRTPQNPCVGSNNWGGASPLLARNIPAESLETKYLRLNTLRTRDEIFPMADVQVDLHRPAAAPGRVTGGAREPVGGGGSWFFFPKLSRRRKKAAPDVISLGAERRKGSGWLPRRDYRSRWPQGWC